MTIDGTAIANDLYDELKKRIAVLPSAPVLAIITCAPNFETKKYLTLKEKRAAAIGIVTRVIELNAESTTEDFFVALAKHARSSAGVIVQLPLPPHIDTEAVLRAIPTTHDVDALNPDTTAILSPVVGAFKTILDTHGIDPMGKRVIIIGRGKLVGRPAERWFTEHGAEVSVVTHETENITRFTRDADIIVCGAGAPGLLRPDMVKEGVIILDAGTSEDGGMLRGDADPACADKAALFTPVPGGIGPITIAVLLGNCVSLSAQ
jgi:methylenetetrahydrofolate dehydrogenase (NADP+)/methenyltetrahydrofolate cyclohydrolase